jgi:carbon-monoxide dehydrogenase large subunit
MDGGLENTAHFEADAFGMQSTNVHVVTVEVFPDTGKVEILRYVCVDDAGVPINPMMVRGQIQGGVALGIGNAMQEAFVYDSAGRQTTNTLTEYLMAGAQDVPHIEVLENNVPTPHTPLGSKGKGEGPTGMVPGALGNAIEDALTPFGVTINELPFTRERIWSLIDDAKQNTDAL